MDASTIDLIDSKSGDLAGPKSHDHLKAKNKKLLKQIDELFVIINNLTVDVETRDATIKNLIDSMTVNAKRDNLIKSVQSTYESYEGTRQNYIHELYIKEIRYGIFTDIINHVAKVISDYLVVRF
jgi:hypothetical protein